MLGKADAHDPPGSTLSWGDFAMVSLIDQLSAQAAATPEHRLLELSVVIPTYEERPNIAPLLAALEAALQGLNWEVIFVDDHSPDHTADSVRELALVNP